MTIENKECHLPDEEYTTLHEIVGAIHSRDLLPDYGEKLLEELIAKRLSNERCDAARYRKMRDHSGNVRWWMLSAIDLQLETMSEPTAADVDAAVDAMPEGPK